MSEEPQFEGAFLRLEEIVDILNRGNLALDESLKLYEEADRLIASCTTLLNNAEQKIETLIKNRAGELQLSPSQQPMTAPFDVGA